MAPFLYGVLEVSEERIAQCRDLMSSFADRTGLTSDRPRARYLWTDAFAVCNFFGLAVITADARFHQLAIALIDQVHQTLGRHRGDDHRSGWLSGLDEDEGAEHPTRGGLRIGKRLPERGSGEPFDERLEWDRDGQYFHYLTRWMHALDVAARSTGEVRFHRWSLELAGAAFRGFIRDGGRPRMAWKMSIDLSRPQVPSAGQLDPVDGLITYSQIERTGQALRATEGSLAGAIRTFASMLDGGILATTDPLGIGGLLAGTWRLIQIEAAASLVEPLLEASLAGLARFALGSDLSYSAPRRLAFRELGLAIGLSAVESMRAAGAPHHRALEQLARYLPLRQAIESFWLEPAHQATAAWREHLDINAVMLATALVPRGYLGLPRGDRLRPSLSGPA